MPSRTSHKPRTSVAIEGLPFYKLSGAGNDFIALVEPPSTPPEGTIRNLCRRALSLGADGLFTLEPTDRGARMIHWNADGGRSELCLNGSRCAARLAFELGWAEETLELLTDSGPLEARCLDASRVALALPPIVGEPVAKTLEVDGITHAGYHLDVGVPHFVLPWKNGLAAAPVSELGVQLRTHPDLAPRGANINFVRFVARDRLEIRTYERGVEAETLACGTGVVAAVAVGIAAGRLDPPVSALTFGGFELRAEGDEESRRLVRPALAGDARLVARGELLPGAEDLPSPARFTG